MNRFLLIIIFLSNICLADTYQVIITQKNTTVMSPIEQAVFDEVNEYRVNSNLYSLKINPNLIQAARAYAKTLAEQDKFEHNDTITPYNLRPEHRVFRTGFFGYRMIWENLFVCSDNKNFKNRTLKKQAEIAVDSWDKSTKGHRETMQNSQVTHTGVGSFTLNGKTYFVQLFAYIPFEVRDIGINEIDAYYEISGFIKRVDKNFNSSLSLLNNGNQTIKSIYYDDTFKIKVKKNSGKQLIQIFDGQYAFKMLFLDTNQKLENVIQTVLIEGSTEDNVWINSATTVPHVTSTSLIEKKDLNIERETNSHQSYDEPKKIKFWYQLPAN